MKNILSITILALTLMLSAPIFAAGFSLEPKAAPNQFQAGLGLMQLDADLTAGKKISFKARLSETTLNEVSVLVVFGGNYKEIKVKRHLKQFSVSLPPAEWESPIQIVTFRGHNEVFLNDEVGGSLYFFENPDTPHKVMIRDLNVLDLETYDGQCN